MSALRRFCKNAGASDMKLAPTWRNVVKSLFEGKRCAAIVSQKRRVILIICLITWFQESQIPYYIIFLRNHLVAVLYRHNCQDLVHY